MVAATAADHVRRQVNSLHATTQGSQNRHHPAGTTAGVEHPPFAREQGGEMLDHRQLDGLLGLCRPEVLRVGIRDFVVRPPHRVRV